MKHGGTGAQWSSGLRPVDLAFDGCGRLVVSSDGTRPQRWLPYRGGQIIRISYDGERQPCPVTTPGAPSNTTDAGEGARVPQTPSTTSSCAPPVMGCPISTNGGATDRVYRLASLVMLTTGIVSTI